MTHASNVALRYMAVMVCGLSLAHARAEAKMLNFDEGRLEQGLMPDGCNNPFRETAKFIDFYETSIVTMAAERGARAKGVESLFAIDSLRDRINEISNRSGGEESAVDRLIVTQLCHYEKIATQKNVGAGAKALQIFAKTPELHDHLAAIAPKLLGDTVALYKAQQRAMRDTKNQENFVISRQNEIRRAKDLGEAKVRQLIE
ncbi:MAG TPA: hypothetical protein VM901_12685 [Bdellovibrionota bacterium]|nr:hypothetical protein [Bdellovibrionota bacterium]